MISYLNPVSTNCRGRSRKRYRHQTIATRASRLARRGTLMTRSILKRIGSKIEVYQGQAPTTKRPIQSRRTGICLSLCCLAYLKSLPILSRRRTTPGLAPTKSRICFLQAASMSSQRPRMHVFHNSSARTRNWVERGPLDRHSRKMCQVPGLTHPATSVSQTDLRSSTI